jgi:dTMP kinase
MAASDVSTVGPRGALILFEGIDRCGKSTQVKLLTEYLQGKVGIDRAKDIRFPDRTSYIGKLINDYLANTASTSGVSDQTIHLLFSANRWEASSGIESSLLSGTTFVCDRYAYSGVSFSSAKGTPGMDLEWCKACDRGLPAPDCVIYLDMPVEAAAKRGNFGEERYEKIDFQLKVREKFMQLKQENDASGASAVPWHTVDADQTIESIRDQIRDIADRTVEEVKLRPIRRLW